MSENDKVIQNAINSIFDILKHLAFEIEMLKYQRKSPTKVSLEKLGNIAYKAFGESGFYAYSVKEKGEYVAKAVLDAAGVKWE